MFYDFCLIVSIRTSSSSQVGKLTLQSSGNEADSNPGELRGQEIKKRKKSEKEIGFKIM